MKGARKRDNRLRMGKKGLRHELGTYYSGFVQPNGKETKRRANRRTRRNLDTPNGAAHKKNWGYWEWC